MATGYFGDRLVIYLARRNNGYKEPEMRLWTLSASFVFTAVGYLAYGWAAQAGESVRLINTNSRNWDIREILINI